MEEIVLAAMMLNQLLNIPANKLFCRLAKLYL